MGTSITVFIFMVLALMAGLFSGYYLFAVLGGVGFIFGWAFWGDGVFEMVYFNTFKVMKDYTLLAIPLFVFMGSMLDRSGVAEKLFDVLSIALGRMKGGLAVAAMLIAIMFAATTGIVGASVVAMGLIFLPAMLKRNYDPAYACGVITSGGTLGILIPPSIMLVVLGSSAGISVGRLFYAAMVPGLLLGGLYILYIIIRAQLNPDLAPPLPEEELNRYTTAQKAKNIVIHVLPVFTVILAVLGSIWLGIAPPTEAAAVGAFAAFIIAILYKRMSMKVLVDTLKETMNTTAMVYMVVICAGLFVSVFMRIGGMKIVADLFVSLPFGTMTVFWIMMGIIFLLGFIMDWIAALLIVLPVFMPIATTLGFDPLWFAAMIAIVFQTSFLTPPFAMALYYLKGIAPEGVSLGHIIKGSSPYIALQVLVLLLCAYIPQIILWLPSKIIGQ